MPIYKNLTGKSFGRLIVIKRARIAKRRCSLWLCLCDCGNQIIVQIGNLKNGHTQSCGCLRIQHGHNTRKVKSRVYGSWSHIIQRCTNVKNKHYHHYGGRGITVCKHWLKFENFLKDMGEPPSNKHSIDRINNNGNYCKSNCRWVIQKQQMRNTRRNRVLSHDGKTQCLTDWAKELKINPTTLFARFRYGWSVQRALTTPVRKRGL